MKSNILGSILGLVAVSTIAGGIVFVAPKISENMGTAVGNAPEVIVSADRVEDDENLSEDLTTDLLTIEKEEEETVVKEEPETETEEVTETTEEETDEKAEAEKPEEKITETAKTVTETIEAATETANVAEEVVTEVTETPAPSEETPAPAPAEEPKVEEPKTEEVVADTPAPNPMQSSVPFANPENDLQRLTNELYSASTLEEYTNKSIEMSNYSFDANGNIVDPNMITSEPETNTVTEVTEEIVIEE